MLAEQCGPDKFSKLLRDLGLGKRTGVGLPGESPGRVPPRGQWSGSTFGNLPIGQGLSMTVLQMAAMYQTLANDGVRVPPRIISARLAPDGTRFPEPKSKPVRVVGKQTARTVRDMLRAVVQDGDGLNNGTGPAAALTGYQVSGKTGTAQQIDPATGTYSRDLYWITFAGIFPADAPAVRGRHHAGPAELLRRPAGGPVGRAAVPRRGLLPGAAVQHPAVEEGEPGRTAGRWISDLTVGGASYPVRMRVLRTPGDRFADLPGFPYRAAVRRPRRGADGLRRGRAGGRAGGAAAARRAELVVPVPARHPRARRGRDPRRGTRPGRLRPLGQAGGDRRPQLRAARRVGARAGAGRAGPAGRHGRRAGLGRADRAAAGRRAPRPRRRVRRRQHRAADGRPPDAGGLVEVPARRREPRRRWTSRGSCRRAAAPSLRPRCSPPTTRRSRTSRTRPGRGRCRGWCRSSTDDPARGGEPGGVGGACPAGTSRSSPRSATATRSPARWRRSCASWSRVRAAANTRR